MTSVYFLLCADPTSVNYLNSFLISFSSNFLEFIYLGKASLLRRTHAFNCLEFPCLSQGRWFKCSASARNAGIKPAILHFSRCNCSFQYYLLFNCYFYFWACSLIGAVSQFYVRVNTCLQLVHLMYPENPLKFIFFSNNCARYKCALYWFCLSAF